MANVLVVFSTTLQEELSKRPGRHKIDKQKAAKPRQALQIVLERLSREMEGEGGTAHLRADIFEEPLHTRRLYRPEGLSILLSNFRALVAVPPGSAFAADQPHGYIAVFDYKRIGWSLIGAYLELESQPVLVFVSAREMPAAIALLERIKAPGAFDDWYARADEAARDAA